MICEALQDVTEGRCRRLVINVPPRTGKSTIVSTIWPVWEWARDPTVQWMFASYSLDLATRDSVKRRSLMAHHWFQDRWGKNFRLSGDQNVKREFVNDKRGIMVATSVGGTVLGRGADRLVIDDPHQPMEALSDVQRASAIMWYDQTWCTRQNDPKKTAQVIIMQRLHEGDLTGHVLTKAKDDWRHIKLPMEWEG